MLHKVNIYFFHYLPCPPLQVQTTELRGSSKRWDKERSTGPCCVLLSAYTAMEAKLKASYQRRGQRRSRIRALKTSEGGHVSSNQRTVCAISGSVSRLVGRRVEHTLLSPAWMNIKHCNYFFWHCNTFDTFIMQLLWRRWWNECSYVFLSPCCFVVVLLLAEAENVLHI